MRKLEVFFDYACPHCLRVHDDLIELLAGYPDISVEWCACEAHPRPEVYKRYSDLLARGLFIAAEQNADVCEYHKRIYHAAITEPIDIEDPKIVADTVKDIVDHEQFLTDLQSGKHNDKLLENNRLAWVEYAFPAVPSYRLDGMLLKSVPGVGVTREMLEAFLSGK